MDESRIVTSVGIDVGTTTTQVIFSQLKLDNVARAGQIPRVDISSRAILYKSEIVFTPLLDADTIDASRLAEIIKREYQLAGILPTNVETGAVIITGETAKKKNADQILKAISGMAGDFVVTIAGPNLESIIAGRGSGAADYSRRHFTSVTNVDIGGGSANSAIFKLGNPVAAAAMNFGGRIIEIDHASGSVLHLAQPARQILDFLGLRIVEGDQPGLEPLRQVCQCMADLTLELIEGTASPLAQKLYLTPPSPVSGRGKILLISGGIGYYFYEPVFIASVSDLTIHNDIGPLLAQCLRDHSIITSYVNIRPPETLRATVLGASSQTVTLSGSTIWTEENILPLKNIPVVRPSLENMHLQPDLIAASAQEALSRWDLKPDLDNFAIALDFDRTLDYQMLTHISAGLIDFARKIPAGHPFVVIVKHDYAQAIGQTIKAMQPDLRLIVIDQVGLDEGDYIDIGMPFMEGRVVPLSVKTLVFYHDTPPKS
jgi:ethanolamine utilization protein EutA